LPETVESLRIAVKDRRTNRAMVDILRTLTTTSVGVLSSRRQA
jgi:hypothetical protein